MKSRMASLAILVCLALAAIPASAQVLYDNGPINGNVDAYTINFGFLASNSFTLSNNSTVGGFDFGVWENAGDVMSSVDWNIASEENGGTLFGSGTASGKNLTDQFISVNSYGYDIDEIRVTGLNVGLKGGTYWLTLQNALVPSGEPVYWDENSGIGCESKGCPSLASENSLGTMPSESFSINGPSGAPEPGSFMLLTSGVLAAAGALRRKLF
jgi:hypothetical protein